MIDEREEKLIERFKRELEFRKNRPPKEKVMKKRSKTIQRKRDATIRAKKMKVSLPHV